MLIFNINSYLII